MYKYIVTFPTRIKLILRALFNSLFMLLSVLTVGWFMNIDKWKKNSNTYSKHLTAAQKEMII